MEQMSSRARWRIKRDRDPEYIDAVLDYEDALHEAGADLEPAEWTPDPREFDPVSDTLRARQLWLLGAQLRSRGVELPDGVELFPMPASPLQEAREQRRNERMVRDTQESFDFLFASITAPPATAGDDTPTP